MAVHEHRRFDVRSGVPHDHLGTARNDQRAGVQGVRRDERDRHRANQLPGPNVRRDRDREG